jgi:hypothetical protein
MSLSVYSNSFSFFSGTFIIGGYPSSPIFQLVTGSYTTTGLNNFTVPVGVTEIYTLLVGGGGGGAGSEGDRNQGYGGGAGGALAFGNITTTPGETLRFFVGAGGTAGANGGGNGGAGGTTYVSSSAGILVQAGGGAGGVERSTAAAAGGISTGSFRLGGGNGGAGGAATGNNTGGGGGGAGGYSGNGGAGGGTGAGANGAGGAGGGGGATDSGLGYGGGGVGIPTSGSAGTGGALNAVGTGGSGGAPGTRGNGGLYGGGGGARDDDSAGGGGAGAQGVIYISYYTGSGGSGGGGGGGAEIVTGSLTHRFDAGDAASYAGSGNVWTNLAGSNNLALVNSPVFVSNASASRFVLDGIDDFMSGSGYLTGSAPKSHTLNLIMSIYQFPSFATTYRFFGDNSNPTSYRMGQWTSTSGPGEVEFTVSTPTNFANIYSVFPNQFISQSQLGMFTFVSSNTSVDFYLNGSLLGQSTTNTFSDNNFISATRTYFLGSDSGTPTNPISMSIAHMMWYSASLSAADVLQNYNALKGRYGI